MVNLRMTMAKCRFIYHARMHNILSRLFEWKLTRLGKVFEMEKQHAVRCEEEVSYMKLLNAEGVES